MKQYHKFVYYRKHPLILVTDRQVNYKYCDVIKDIFSVTRIVVEEVQEDNDQAFTKSLGFFCAEHLDAGQIDELLHDTKKIIELIKEGNTFKDLFATIEAFNDLCNTICVDDYQIVKKVAVEDEMRALKKFRCVVM